MKTVFMFSGQGSQTAGMGKALYDNFDCVKEIFGKASDALGYDIRQICFEKNELLNETSYSQPALLTVGYSAFKVLSEKTDCDFMMGLSLGEYTALTAAGAFSFEDAVPLVKKRGELMNGAKGGMSAVKNLDIKAVYDICDKTEDVYVANYNSFEQIVIAGSLEMLPKAEELIKEAKGKCMRLKVSGPFHTPLLSDIAAEFNKELEKARFNKPTAPIITNVTGKLLPDDAEAAMENLKIHMISGVRWVDSVLTAMSQGADTFVELGPGKTLCNLVTKIAQGRETNVPPCDGVTYPEEVKVYNAEELIWENQ